MDRAHFDSRAQSKLRITGKIIELNDVVWSVPNLVAIAITKKVIHFNDTAPTFKISEPKFKFPFWALIVLLFATITLSMFNKIIFTVLTLLCVACFGLYLQSYRRKVQRSREDWVAEQQKYVQETEIWKHKKDNPPILYGLVLETSAASRSTIFSYDKLRISEAHSAIKTSMNAKDSGETFVMIDTVNVGGSDSINNFDSEIINQKIED
ncbi:hypothetical protein [Undibacterium sp. RuTC16W]|uniref:hypothetical protein n=1 Tax=Undibacterium sp. RuTC16W TaxID=3413048 RepID=UPI003BF0DBCE